MTNVSGVQRVAVITGASQGIGATLARRLVRDGWRVVAAARNEVGLAALADALGPHAVEPVRTDVTVRGDVERLLDRALQRFGAIDVWVNNAGRGISVPTLELTDEQFDAIMAVNVKSALYGMQVVVPYFRTRGRGHVINVSSFLGRVPLATFRSAYNAAKAALNALTANARVDLARTDPGIKVSLVMPGVVTTEFPRNVIGDNAARPVTSGAGAQSPEEVADAIAELIEHPRAELYTNPRQVEILRRYYEDVEEFERGMGSHA